jgi:hypothetical protein
MGEKAHSDEVSETENMLLETGGRESCYKMAKNLPDLCLYSSVLWKVELVRK